MSYVIAWALALLTALLAGWWAYWLPAWLGIALAVGAVFWMLVMGWRNGGAGPCLLFVLMLPFVFTGQDEPDPLTRGSLLLGLVLAGVGMMALGGAGPSGRLALLSALMGVFLIIFQGPTDDCTPLLRLTLYQSLAVLLTVALRLLARPLWLLAPLCVSGYLSLLWVMQGPH